MSVGHKKYALRIRRKKVKFGDKNSRRTKVPIIKMYVYFDDREPNMIFMGIVKNIGKV